MALKIIKDGPVVIVESIGQGFMDQIQSPEGIAAVAGTVTGMLAGGMAGKKINAKLSAGKGAKVDDWKGVRGAEAKAIHGNGKYNVKRGLHIKDSKIYWGRTPEGPVTKVSSAKKINDWWKKKGYDQPPYKPGTIVKEVKLSKDTKYVRVYDGDVSGKYGGWVMKPEDVKGLTPKQIQKKYALPQEPKYIFDVELPKGTTVRKGIANKVDKWGKGGGVQYDLRGNQVGKFTNERKLK